MSKQHPDLSDNRPRPRGLQYSLRLSKQQSELSSPAVETTPGLTRAEGTGPMIGPVPTEYVVGTGTVWPIRSKPYKVIAGCLRCQLQTGRGHPSASLRAGRPGPSIIVARWAPPCSAGPAGAVLRCGSRRCSAAVAAVWHGRIPTSVLTVIVGPSQDLLHARPCRPALPQSRL